MSNIIEILKSCPDYIGASGCTEAEIKEAEEKLMLSFSKDYREYLREIGLACFNGHEFTGVTKNKRLDVVAVTKEMQNIDINVAKNWYVIEEGNIDGLCVWQDESGNIYLKSLNTEVKKIASSLTEYIENNI